MFSAGCAAPARGRRWFSADMDTVPVGSLPRQRPLFSGAIEGRRLHGLDMPFAVLGPGDLGLSGRPDELVSIASVQAAAAIYAAIAESWLS